MMKKNKKGAHSKRFVLIGNNRGQLTLFVVMALLIVIAIGIGFYYVRPDVFSQSDTPPVLESCISGSLDAKIKTLALTAGKMQSGFSYPYIGENYTYLCYTEEYYTPCVNQEPLLTRVFEDSLVSLLKSEFQDCYDSSVEDLKRRGYEVSSGVAEFNISIEPGEIRVEIDAPTTVSTGDTTTSTQKYKYSHRTNLYEVIMVAVSLVQFETFYGDSEQTAQMFYYPNIFIDKQRRGDGTKVYTLKEKNEGIEYRFAVKSFPWPAGDII